MIYLSDYITHFKLNQQKNNHMLMFHTKKLTKYKKIG